MDAQTIQNAVIGLVVGLYLSFTIIRRLRKNGKAPEIQTTGDPAPKRINWKDAYADQVLKNNQIEESYKHDRERDQQKIEVLETTVQTLKSQVEANSQQALEFKIAREALDKRNQDNAKLFASLLEEKTVAHTTTEMQNAAQINDLSSLLAEAREDINRLSKEMADVKQLFAHADKGWQACRETNESLKSENGRLRADNEILGRKLERASDTPDTDELDTKGSPGNG